MKVHLSKQHGFKYQGRRGLSSTLNAPSTLPVQRITCQRFFRIGHQRGRFSRVRETGLIDEGVDAQRADVWA